MKPYYNSVKGNKIHTIDEFKGYCRKATPAENQMTDMQNMTLDNYPALSSRMPRRIAKKLTRPHGLYAHNGLWWVDGTTLYRNGVAIYSELTDTDKRFCSMGAYLIIMPDGIVVNTDDVNYPCENMISSQLITGTIFYFSDINGNDAEAESGYLKMNMPIEFLHKDDYIEIIDGDELLNGWHRICEIINSEDGSYIVIDYNHSELPTQTSFKISRGFPQNDFMVSVENRLWCCSSVNHEIYASGLGSPFNWNRFEGISTDSYAATVGSTGDFSGACSLYSYAFFFKENCYHKVYGSYPSEFVVAQDTIKGIAEGSGNSIAYIKNGVCYLGTDGFYYFGGSTPTFISEDLGRVRYSDAVGGSLHDKYYVSCMEETSAKDGGTTKSPVLLCYDFDSRRWSKIDSLRITHFATYDNLLYALSSQGEILCFDDGETGYGYGDNESEGVFEWYAEFDALADKPYQAKYLKRVFCDVDVISGNIQIEVSYDGAKWINRYESTKLGRQTIVVPCSTVRCSRCLLRIRGSGDIVIHSISKEFEEGGFV